MTFIGMTMEERFSALVNENFEDVVPLIQANRLDQFSLIANCLRNIYFCRSFIKITALHSTDSARYSYHATR